MKNRIDYTVIGHLTNDEIRKIINFTNKHKPRALVVSYNNLMLVNEKLSPNIKLVTVGGFPFESLDGALSCSDLANEFDMVIPVKAYYEKQNIKKVYNKIKTTKKQLRDKTLKVIIETALMTKKQYQITELVKCVEDAGGDIIKTNTGRFDQLLENNKTRKREFKDLLEDVRYIKDITDLPIKASGGVKNEIQAKKLLSLSVNIIGTSSKFWAYPEKKGLDKCLR